jgi:hypothetical protein
VQQLFLDNTIPEYYEEEGTDNYWKDEMGTLKTVRRDTVTGARTTGALREVALASPGNAEEATGGERAGRSAHTTPSKVRVVPPRR